MATKKSTAQEAPEVVNTEAAEAGPLDQPDPMMLKMQAEIERLKKENEQLKINSIYSGSPAGSESDVERVRRACEQADRDGVDPWTVKISVLAQRIGKGV